MTDDDITEMAGERDKMVGKLQEKYGYAKDEAEAEVDKFMRDRG